jgi:hypothetical protein
MPKVSGLSFEYYKLCENFADSDTEEEKSAECPDCGEVLFSKRSLYRHAKKHNSTSLVDSINDTKVDKCTKRQRTTEAIEDSTIIGMS